MPQLKRSESEKAMVEPHIGFSSLVPRPLLYRTASDGKLGGGLGMRLGFSLHCHIFSRSLCIYSVYKVKPTYIMLWLMKAWDLFQFVL